MKKLTFLILFLGINVFSYSHPANTHFDYSIIFIGKFKNDSISITINQISLIKNYQFDNSDAEKKGNLSLTQYDKKIEVYYNGSKKVKTKIPVQYILDLGVTVNGVIKKLKVDLRKGKVILVDYKMIEKQKAIISIEQLTEPLIL